MKIASNQKSRTGDWMETRDEQVWADGQGKVMVINMF